MAGTLSMPLKPCRRHIIIGTPKNVKIGDWPLVADLSHRYYFRPESGGILTSPMDEDEMQPCDPLTDELWVATAADRLSRYAPKLTPHTIANKWAGLRTLSRDGAPIIGEDPKVRGFFWLAGLGGSGMETSPAVGRIGADLLCKGKTGVFDARIVDPGRFRGGRISTLKRIYNRSVHFSGWMLKPQGFSNLS